MICGTLKLAQLQSQSHYDITIQYISYYTVPPKMRLGCW